VKVVQTTQPVIATSEQINVNFTVHHIQKMILDLICGQNHMLEEVGRVDQNLLKSKELHYTEVHRRMEAKTTLVRTKRLVKLNSKPPVHMCFSLVIHPRYSEYDYSFWLHHAM
jgi:hypothetical protein